MTKDKDINWLRVVTSKRWRSLTKTERLVMVSLIARRGFKAPNKYHCWPSFKEIANDMGLERRAIMRAVASLRDASHIVVWTKEGCRNHYSVSLWRDPDQCTEKTLVKCEIASVQKRHGGVSREDTRPFDTHLDTEAVAA